MPAFPVPFDILGPTDLISVWSTRSMGGIIGVPSGTPAGVAIGTNNRAFFYPFRIGVPVLVNKIWWLNGGTVAGNIDAGVYDSAGTRLVSTGSTAQSGTNAIQTVDVGDVRIGPGLFYLAIAGSNSTAQIFGRSTGMTAAMMKLMGGATQDTAFPLPATATFAAFAAAIFLQFGISTRATI